MIVEAQFLDDKNSLVRLEMDDGHVERLDLNARPINKYHLQFGKYRKKKAVKGFVKTYIDLGATVKYKDQVIFKSDYSIEWNKVLSEVEAGTAVIERLEKDPDSYSARRETRYNEEGLTAEAWTKAIIQKDVDGDDTEYNALVVKRENIKKQIPKR